MKPNSNYLATIIIITWFGENQTMGENQHTRRTPCIPTVKHDEGSILIWGCFSSAGTGDINIIKEIMNSQKYIEILANHFRNSARILEMGRRWVFQHDNDRKHTSKQTSDWLKKHQCPRVA